MATVSFTSAGNYQSSMERLVALIRSQRGTTEPVVVDVQTHHGTFQVLLRCTDLWILGFTAGNGETYYFEGLAPEGSDHSNVLPLNGSHDHLGTEGLVIKAGTFAVLADLVKFEGRCHANVAKALALVVIAISEAARFDEIQAGIRRVLAYETPSINNLGGSSPNSNTQWLEMIKNWRKSSNDPEWDGFVRLKHIG